MSKKTPFFSAIIIAVATMLTVSASVAHADAAVNDDVLYLVFPDGSEVPADVALGQYGFDLDEPSNINSRLIGFGQWISCFQQNNVDDVFETYEFWWAGKQPPKRMKCGDDGFGYRHIRIRHESEWQKKLNEVTPFGLLPDKSWDDVMSIATAIALLDPYDVQFGANNKGCALGKIVFKVNGSIVQQFGVTAVFATNNDRIITSYPVSVTAQTCRPN